MKMTTQSFKEAIQNTKGLLVVDFWAEWCGPCKMLAPVFEELEKDFPDVTFGKINVDEEVQAALENNVSCIPTLLFIKDGEVVKTYSLVVKADVNGDGVINTVDASLICQYVVDDEMTSFPAENK